MVRENETSQVIEGERRKRERAQRGRVKSLTAKERGRSGQISVSIFSCSAYKEWL